MTASVPFIISEEADTHVARKRYQKLAVSARFGGVGPLSTCCVVGLDTKDGLSGPPAEQRCIGLMVLPELPQLCLKLR
jgi:hypothetical protein